MFGIGETYFRDVREPKCHFIITGRTNDIFCNDSLNLVDIKILLHDHLMKIGYDAVIFMDRNRMLYCFDAQSYTVLREGSLSEDTSGDRTSRTTSRRRRRLRHNDDREPRTPSAQRNSSENERWNLGSIEIVLAWTRIARLMENTELSIAFVFDSVNALQDSLSQYALHALENLSSVQRRNLQKPPSSAFYIFRENSLAHILDNAGYASNPSWSSFYHTVLVPRINTPNAEDNRVINISTPNAAEIANLLNYLRLRDDNRVLINQREIIPISQYFAESCGRKNWQLSDLLTAITRYAESNPDTLIENRNRMEIMNDEDHRTSDEILENMVGMNEVKERIRRLHFQFDESNARNKFPQYSDRLAPIETNKTARGSMLNCIFKGPSGTGKSTIAELMAQVYYDLGLLPRAHVVTVDASRLTSQNVGGTAPLVRSFVQEAIGCVLFIDEAYALSSNTHSREAVDQLVADMSSYEGQFAVILAGYSEPMDEFMRLNEGLYSRFPESNIFEFDNYTPEEMNQILHSIALNDSDKITFSPELENILPVFCENWTCYNGRKWGNGKAAINLLNDMKEAYPERLSRENIHFNGEYVFTPADIPAMFRDYLNAPAQNIEELYEKIDSMIGLDNVKKYLRSLGDRIIIDGKKVKPGNYIFYGPPGTGKTTTVERMCEMLCLLKVIKRRQPVTRTAGELMHGNDPRENVRTAVSDARGSVLFIDEAHQLMDTDAGRQVLSELVPLVEDPDITSDTGFILAGYSKEMQRLIDYDPGINRRFPKDCRIRFDDYSAGDLVRILESMLEKQGEHPTEEYLARSRFALQKFLEGPHTNFGNGGYIRSTYIPGSIRARNDRLVKKYGGENGILTSEMAALIPELEKTTLTAEDLPKHMAERAGPIGADLPPERTPETRLNELYGKNELVKYVKGRRSDGSMTFFDESSSSGLFFAISGASGSGRKTAVEAMAAMWKDMDFLNRNDVVYASKGTLEAGFVGQTAQKTRDVVEDAIGGTLCVLNPSSMLSRGDSGRSYGPEALGEIAAAMSNHPNDLSVVFIDTVEGMEAFLSAYSSIKGMLSREFEFEDLSPEDMYNIFKLKTERNMVFDDSIKDMISEFFVNWVSDRGGLKDNLNLWGNGAELEKLIDTLKTNWQNQNGQLRYENKLPHRVITAEMFPKKMRKYLKPSLDVSKSAMQQLDELTGLRRVKETIKNIERRLRFMDSESVMPGVYCYLGNPGIGKTTVAKIMGGVFKAVGVLKQGHVIVRTARQMAADYHNFDKMLKLARNGILFIDEAHQLAGSREGLEVIQRILTAIEDTEKMKDVCIILAGYPAEMRYMLSRDSGLNSRFGTEDSMVYFDDYNPEELMQILRHMTAKAPSYPQIGSSYPLQTTEEYLRRSFEIFRDVCSQGKSDFGNARFVRNYVHDSISVMLERFEKEYGDEKPPQEAQTLLTESDIPQKYKSALKNTSDKAVVSREAINTAIVSQITNEIYDSFFRKYSIPVVYIEIYEKGSLRADGTGFLISSEGHILTCAHVANDGDSFRVRIRIPGMIGGDNRWFDCKKLEPNFKSFDMAVLKIEGKNFPRVSLRPLDIPVSQSEETIIIGYPLSDVVNGDSELLTPNHFGGRISSIQTLENGIERCMIDSSGKQGNSGSPVFSKTDGRVIGVFAGSVTNKGDFVEEINFFYPIKYFWENFVDDEQPSAFKDLEVSLE